jgi:hypothetical protein
MNPRALTFDRLLLGGVMLALTGCPGDDVPSDTDGGSSTGGETDDSGSLTNVTSMTNATTTGDTADSSGGDTTTDPTDPTNPTGDTGTTDTGGAVCGDDMVEGGEACDGTDLSGADCVSEGFESGTLACAGDCTFDTSKCVAAPCEDEDIGSAIGPAVSVGNTFGADNDLDASCGGMGGEDQTIRFTAPADGTYVFDTFGSGFDTKISLFGNCDVGSEIDCNDDVAMGNLLSLVQLDMTMGESVLIVIDGFDGEFGDYVLNITQPGICGNDIINAFEACDGVELSGQDCGSLGFAGGTLSCLADCSAYDTSECVYGGDCCADNMSPGCEDPTCTAAVCAFDDFCCLMTWDQQCADEATLEPACAGVGGSCPPPPFPCEDENIGTATGAGVSTGTTVGDDDDLDGSCGNGNGEDRVIRFTSTVAGDYTFDTIGSSFNTELSLFGSCDQMSEIACNDNIGMGNPQSQLTQTLAAGQTVLVVIDGFNGASGDYVLNIAPPPLDLTCSEGVGVVPSSMGTNVAGDDDLTESCIDPGSVESVIEYTATVAGVHTFDLIGSDYDTALAAFFDCGGLEIDCNDDFGGNPDCGGFPCSQLSLDLSAGQTVLLAVAGYAGATGNWTLNITEP